jgi:hypothetical protein
MKNATQGEVRGTNDGIELHLRAEETGEYNYISSWKREWTFYYSKQFSFGQQII